MNNTYHHNNFDVTGKFFSLKKTVDQKRGLSLKKRLSDQPQATDLEYLLGAFLEMYEPHLDKIVQKLAKKGYAIDPSSGFGGKNAEFQVISGNFTFDYITKNKIEKMGVKFREYNNCNSLIFWPDKASIDHIIGNWTRIVEALPEQDQLKSPSMSNKAIEFRRKYLPLQVNLRKQRLFEKLRFSVQNKKEEELKKRQLNKPHPTKIELSLGLFMEELEPQVRPAIISLYEKGYSTDDSGFMDNPSDQMIDGDFTLEEKTTADLYKIGATVETNPSGYTRIQFRADEPNLTKIQKKWNSIISLLPDKKTPAFPSMTRRARDFRSKYQ